MKSLIVFIPILFSIQSFCQMPPGRTDAEKKEAIIRQMENSTIECRKITVAGLKAIRHDAIVRCRFRYAHQLKKQIKQS